MDFFIDGFSDTAPANWSGAACHLPPACLIRTARHRADTWLGVINQLIT